MSPSQFRGTGVSPRSDGRSSPVRRARLVVHPHADERAESWIAEWCHDLSSPDLSWLLLVTTLT